MVSSKQRYWARITYGMPPELASLCIAIGELKSEAKQATARNHDGDGSTKWGKIKCIRGHDLYGPKARVYRGNGMGTCLRCAKYLRRQRANRDYELSPTGVRLYRIFGKSKTMIEWSKEFGIKRATVVSRIANGMTLQKALTNSLRRLGTHCYRGHELTSLNIVTYKNNRRRCKICQKMCGKKSREKIKRNRQTRKLA